MIEFQAGYYEWLVYLDGETVYAWVDFIDQIPYPLRQKADLENTVDDLIEQMKWDFDTGEIEIDPRIKAELYDNLENLKEQMINRLYYEYGEPNERENL